MDRRVHVLGRPRPIRLELLSRLMDTDLARRVREHGDDARARGVQIILVPD